MICAVQRVQEWVEASSLGCPRMVGLPGWVTARLAVLGSGWGYAARCDPAVGVLCPGASPAGMASV